MRLKSRAQAVSDRFAVARLARTAQVLVHNRWLVAKECRDLRARAALVAARRRAVAAFVPRILIEIIWLAAHFCVCCCATSAIERTRQTASSDFRDAECHLICMTHRQFAPVARTPDVRTIHIPRGRSPSSLRSMCDFYDRRSCRPNDTRRRIRAV